MTFSFAFHGWPEDLGQDFGKRFIVCMARTNIPRGSRIRVSLPFSLIYLDKLLKILRGIGPSKMLIRQVLTSDSQLLCGPKAIFLAPFVLCHAAPRSTVPYRQLRPDGFLLIEPAKYPTSFQKSPKTLQTELSFRFVFFFFSLPENLYTSFRLVRKLRNFNYLLWLWKSESQNLKQLTTVGT